MGLYHRCGEAGPFGRLRALGPSVIVTSNLVVAADGLSNKEIGARLVISEKTVKNHTANIFSKLQVNDRTQAVVLALRKGLITMSPDDSR